MHAAPLRGSIVAVALAAGWLSVAGWSTGASAEIRSVAQTPSPSAATPDPTGIESLYDRLAKARTDDEAKALSLAIERLQLRSGSDTADLLMVRAIAAFQGGSDDLAIAILSAILKQTPDFTEAWNKRATVYFHKGDYARSVADIAETLRRQPRHVGALSGLGMILRETGDKKHAYAAFERALAANPHLDTIRKALDDLRPDVEGRDI